MLGDKIKELRNEKNIYQQDLATALMVSKSTVAMWETNKRVPDKTMLIKIAEYFDITVDYLLEEEHRASAIQKYGFCYTPEEVNEKKAESRHRISSGKLSDPELINEAVTVLKALFSRSLAACWYNPKHVSFENYCAMILNQEQRSIFGELPEAKYQWLKAKLIKIYGQKPGIEYGTYYNVDPAQPSLAVNATKKSLPATGARSDLIGNIEDLSDEEALELKGFIDYLKSKRQAHE